MMWIGLSSGSTLNDSQMRDYQLFINRSLAILKGLCGPTKSACLEFDRIGIRDNRHQFEQMGYDVVYFGQFDDKIKVLVWRSHHIKGPYDA